VFRQRALEAELMDKATFGPQEVNDTFRFIEPVNRWLGGSRAILSFFERESQSWSTSQSYEILDVGCGSGDIPVTLARWGQRRGFRLHIQAIDNHPDTLELARHRGRNYPEITFDRQDLYDLAGDQADYVLLSMLLHHLPDDAIPAVLQRMLTVCRRKVAVNDLLRAPLAYCGTWLFSLFASAVFRHDARLSVRKGFTLDELKKLLADHGFRSFHVERHFFYRFLLTLDKKEPV